MFHQLLVAIDDSPSTPVTLSFATALAQRDGASVHVLHANRMLFGGRGITEIADTDAALLVEGAVTQLVGQGVSATGSVTRAMSFTIGRVVAVAAHSRRCDAIVIGSRRRSRAAHPFGRGTRERIIRSATLPVLTAPAPLQLPGRRRRPGMALLPTRRARTPVDR